MDKGFIVKSQSEALGKILLGAYNHNTGELITIGPHFITVGYSLFVLTDIFNVIITNKTDMRNSEMYLRSVFECMSLEFSIEIH